MDTEIDSRYGKIFTTLIMFNNVLCEALTILFIKYVLYYVHTYNVCLKKGSDQLIVYRGIDR